MSKNKINPEIELKRQKLNSIHIFWEQQKIFNSQFSTKMNEMITILKNQYSSIEQGVVNEIIGFSKQDNSETFIEGVSFITSMFEQFNEAFTKTYQKVDIILNDIKETKKLFEKNKNQEMLTSSFYQLSEYLKWETPLMICNFFSAFEQMCSTGEVFFGMHDRLPQIKDKSQKLKQSYVMKSMKTKETVFYCNKTLREILDAEKRAFYQLPRVVENMLLYLYNQGCSTHGLFRENPNASKKTVDEIYHRMGHTDFEDLPPDVVATVLKKFLRDMKEKLFSHQVSVEMFKLWQKLRSKNDANIVKQKRDMVQSMFKKLPPENLTLLRSLLKLCYKIDSMSDINGMPMKNIAVCLAPTLMTVGDESNSKPVDIKSGSDLIICIEIVTFIMTEYPQLFPHDVDKNVVRRSKRLSQLAEKSAIEELNKSIALVEKQQEKMLLQKPSNPPPMVPPPRKKKQVEKTEVVEEVENKIEEQVEMNQNNQIDENEQIERIEYNEMNQEEENKQIEEEIVEE